MLAHRVMWAGWTDAIKAQERSCSPKQFGYYRHFYLSLETCNISPITRFVTNWTHLEEINIKTRGKTTGKEERVELHGKWVAEECSCLIKVECVLIITLWLERVNKESLGECATGQCNVTETLWASINSDLLNRSISLWQTSHGF